MTMAGERLGRFEYRLQCRQMSAPGVCARRSGPAFVAAAGSPCCSSRLTASRAGSQQNHFIASHSTSRGEVMSPVISTLPFQIPNGLFCADRYGTSSAIGFPCLVTMTGSPVAATSSIKARHLALNSEAFTRFAMAAPPGYLWSCPRSPARARKGKASPPALHLHVRPRRVFERREFAAADLARGYGLGVLAFEPVEPVRPPGAGMLGRGFEPGIDVGAFRLVAGPILVLRLGWRIDHAGDVAGAGEDEFDRAAEKLTPGHDRLGPRDVVLARGEVIDRHLDLLEVERDAGDLHLAFGQPVIEIAIAQIEGMVRRRHARGVGIPIEDVEGVG